MRVVLCALAKNEHLYINEFVKHYVGIGFDTIYIYDNDDLNAPHIEDYIDEKFKKYVEIINIRGMSGENMQHNIYKTFYDTHKFEWCLYCDIDEFLVGVDNVKDFLSQRQFKMNVAIRVKWRLFGDDDLIERDMSKSLMETFTKEITTSLNRDLKTKGNLEKQGKSFIRGGIQDFEIHSPHFGTVKDLKAPLPSVLPSGKICKSGIDIRENYSKETVYLNHYMTKSLKEFIDQKLNRNDAVFNKSLTVDYYWRINTKTPEKIEYLRNRGLIL